MNNKKEHILYDEIFCRNSISKKEQEKIRKTVFGIIGLGGVGGFVFENLVRLGAEEFIIFEHERFDLSNLNRQVLATINEIDKEKNMVAVERAISINPRIKKEHIKLMGEFIESSSIKSCDILIDGSDNLKTRILASKISKKQKIPYVFAAANDSRGMISVLIGKTLDKILKMPKDARDRFEVCSSILSPAAGISGSMAAAEALNVVLKKPIIKAPKFLFFDLFSENPFWIKRI